MLSSLQPALRDDIFTVVQEFASARHKQSRGALSVDGVLELASAMGFAPGTIVDVGAFVGDWARMAREIFPNAQLLMVDGNPERKEALERVVQELGSRAKYFIRLLGPEVREKVTLHLLASGTSVLPELTSFKAKQIEVAMCPLDMLLQSEIIVSPVLLKVDVQGFELEVLMGSRMLLDQSELVVLEVATLPYNEGAPLFGNVIRFMGEAGFVVFDFGAQFRRQTDHALVQIDVVFARENSPLRERRKFWLNEP
jgi:FkbM family methyltransferase